MKNGSNTGRNFYSQRKINTKKNESINECYVGYTKEDALVFVLEMLDCNGCSIDMTRDEYDCVLAQII